MTKIDEVIAIYISRNNMWKIHEFENLMVGKGLIKWKKREKNNKFNYLQIFYVLCV